MITWVLSIISIIGTWLNAKKLWCCFIIWIACNTGWFIWDIINMVYSRAVLDMVQTVFCIYGLYEWRNEK